MPDREKVIKELETEIQDFSPACTSDERLKEIMEMALELLKGSTISGWVSVNDRLPEHGKRYLIYATSGDNKIGYITMAAFGGHFVLSGRRAYWKVTHWMPFPEPPEVSENG